MSSPSLQGKVMYLRCQLNDALQVYTDAAALSRDQREIEHISLYEKGKNHIQWALAYPNTLGPTPVHISEKFISLHHNYIIHRAHNMYMCIVNVHVHELSIT